jgi:hypothetical protein
LNSFTVQLISAIGLQENGKAKGWIYPAARGSEKIRPKDLRSLSEGSR